jgi:Putative Ig domain/Bacterial Ig-like domain (group 1)
MNMRRHENSSVRGRVAVLFTLLAVCASPLVAMGTSGADEPSGAQFTAAVPISPDPTSGQTVTPGTPFSSGQTISIQVPANTALNPNSSVVVVECAAPGDVLPTQTNACDPLSVQGDTIIPASNGSFTYNNYQIYALPDAISLGETPSSAVHCDLSHPCVLYIGNNYNDFTQPHFWSQPFFISPNADDGGKSPGDGSAMPATPAPSPSLSTVAANPTTEPANGVASTTVTVTLKGVNSASQTVPIPGAPVSLGQGSGHSTITPPSTTTNSSGVATFTVKDGTAEAVTYTATSGSVTVTQTAEVTFQHLAQSITFTSTPPSHATVGGPTYSVAASGGGSGNPVTFSIDPSSTSGCSISSTTVSFPTRAGTCVIDANQAGNGSYTAAPQVQQTFTVSVLIITTGALPGATKGQPYSTTLAASGGNPPYKWKLVSGKPPKGLKLSKGTGTIAGTPSSKAVTSTFTVEAFDTKVGKPKTQNTTTATFTIAVS